MRNYSAFKLIALLIFSFLCGAIFTSYENPITTSIIENAEKLIGLEFTESERDSMLDGLKDQLKYFKNIHNYPLTNNITPSLEFNPLPYGYVLPAGQSNITLNDYAGTKLPTDITEITFYSIGQLAHLLKTKQITSERLTKFYIERIKKYAAKLECLITLTEDLALAQAKRADKEISEGKYKGLLHGIPYGIKDLLTTKNYKTTWGAAPYKDQLINEDAAVVRKLQEAGAVLVAKLSMGELAMDNYWFGGETRNPWDITKGSSGSSAGSASAVSGGLLPFAIGTETWGSIISPSTVCGVTGLRPTYNRVSRNGAMALSWSMDKIGTICRNAEDCAIVLKCIAGPDNGDKSAFDVPFNYSPIKNLKGIRVGYLKSDFDSNYTFKQNDSLTLIKMRELGAELIPIELPKFPVIDLSVILTAEAGAAFDELTRSNKDDMLVRQSKIAWPNIFRLSRFIPAVEYINAGRIRRLLIEEMEKLFKNIDLYIAPSFQGDNLLLTNLTGHPSICIPNGFDKDGLPTSITFTGRLFDEGKIIAVAKYLQDATNFHKKHPPMNF